MDDFDQFERRVAAAIRSDADLSVGPFEARSIAHAAIADTQPGATRHPRVSPRRAGRFGRGRGLTLLAAAALLLVGGALAAGSGLVRLPSLVPPEPEPSLAADATPPPTTAPPAPTALASPAPTDVAPPVAGPGGVWIATAPMVTPGNGSTPVRLLDGRVLATGGAVGEAKPPTSAELYDPETGTWSATGSMIHPQDGFDPTLLGNGKVLVGDALDDAPGDGSGSGGAELYDPATGTWAATGKMVRGTALASATLLRDGRVLVTDDVGAQLYDPDLGTWSATGSMTTPRYNTTATLLPDGRVLVAGGDVRDVATDSAELYDPDTGTWTKTASLPATGNKRYDHITATLLQNGTVLVVRHQYAATYDPSTGKWTPTRAGHVQAAPTAATRLLDGTVLVGRASDKTFAEVYDPATKSWTTTLGGIPGYGAGSATLLLDGTVLAMGGPFSELYIPAGVSPPRALLDLPSPTPTPTPTQIPTLTLPAAESPGLSSTATNRERLPGQCPDTLG